MGPPYRFDGLMNHAAFQLGIQWMNEWMKQLNNEPLIQLFPMYPSYINLVLADLKF